MSGTVLITGATGFIGRHLVRYLCDRLQPVLLVVRKETDRNRFKGFPNVTCVIYDDRSGLLEQPNSVPQIEGVIHLASNYVKDHRPELIPALVSANVTFGTQILEFAAKAGANWFLNVGSVWQHSNNTMRNPANLYAASKNAFEEIIRFYALSTNLLAFNLYLGDTYGPADSRRKILNIWAEAATTGEVVPMSPGLQKISLLHVEDVVSALAKVVDGYEVLSSAAGAHGASFSLEAKAPISLRSLADIFREATSLSLRIDWGALPYRPGEVMEPSIPFPSFPLGSPERSLKQGLADVFGPG